ncbi:MAG: tRNA 4-thiouridine(8) synthase ThiI [candidate division KSB1 bacterium]|nr:tRNA 4-thiouridine(8) synthase ThiI [candidate division KSB1 bacterium]MDZ7302894.1 tRNA 4-thiouridine(8) synthase ThiI [candidate division KSB1 bacterium]MDZ7310469.1 tRNA 4-thiouridine(8) synthase ThiI [candidate division KSB1 bacterium]
MNSVLHNEATEVEASARDRHAFELPVAPRAILNGVVIHYHEIALKLGNRRFFERQLRRNVLRATTALGMKEVLRLSGRMLGILESGSDLGKIVAALKKVFGIAYFAPAVKLEQDLDEIKENAVRLLEEKKFATFKVETKRGQKQFPLTSVQINIEVGTHIGERFPARVDLSHPELTLHIEIVDNYALMYTDRIEGPGGLPVGTSERAVCLISGGIDSPVAAYKMMKRGIKLIFVHFHSAPFTSTASQRNVERLVELLNTYQFRSKLYLVPFAEIQQHIVANAPPSYRVLLYRRAMIRLAEMIAAQNRAHALITGENVAQVASQTLTNIRVIDQAATLPILRPLAGDDKQEIVAMARHLGTFEISTEPFEDCCSLFVPANPETRAKLSRVQKIEAKLDLQPLLAPTLEKTILKTFRFNP